MNIQETYNLIGCAGVALIVIGAFATYITGWNFIYLRGVLSKFKKNFTGMDNASPERVGRYFGASTNPLECIVRDIVMTHSAHSDDIRAEVAYLFHKHFKPVNNALTWLKVISAISPLLGLLGTVVGMVTVFRAISESSSPDPTLLAGGIWSALITTVMGLVVAIPSLMAYYYLVLRIKEMRIEAVEYSYRALNIRREFCCCAHEVEKKSAANAEAA